MTANTYKYLKCFIDVFLNPKWFISRYSKVHWKKKKQKQTHVPKLSTSLFRFAKSKTSGPIKKWSSISIPRSWMEGIATGPAVLEFKFILGVAGLANG